MSEFHDDILVRNPAVNPPYLTMRGKAVVFLIILMCTATAAAYFQNAIDLAELSAAVAAATVFMLSACYARLLISWHDVHKSKFHVDFSTHSQHPVVGSEFSVECRLHNTGRLGLRVEAMRLLHSTHLDFEDYPDPFELPRASMQTITLTARAQEYGRGRIVGIGFSQVDVFQLFRAENHYELSEEIDVYFDRRIQKSDLNFQAFLKQFQQRVSIRGEQDAPESLRPYQNGDPMRRIAWRHFASHGDLNTLYFSRNEENSLLCLIDAGPRMRLVNDHQNNLADIIQCIALCAGDYRDMTLMAYDEETAEIIAERCSPEKAMDLFDAWCMKTLEWRPPRHNDAARKEEWSLASTYLHRHFKLYKNVDFSSHQADGRHVDLKGLVTWYLSSQASAELDRGNARAASKILHSPYDATLVSLIREKCCMPRTSLSPNETPLRFHKILPLLKQLEKKSAFSQIIWFSDFTTPLSASTLNDFLKQIQKTHPSCLGVIMPMPFASQNLHMPQAAACRKDLCRSLRAAFEFIERSGS